MGLPIHGRNYFYGYSYLLSRSAKGVQVTEKGIVLNKRVFYSGGGGGQPCDIRKIGWKENAIQVNRAYSSEGNVVYEV